jgi:hypothetical protein
MDSSDCDFEEDQDFSSDSYYAKKATGILATSDDVARNSMKGYLQSFPFSRSALKPIQTTPAFHF